MNLELERIRVGNLKQYLVVLRLSSRRRRRCFRAKVVLVFPCAPYLREPQIGVVNDVPVEKKHSGGYGSCLVKVSDHRIVLNEKHD